MIAIALALGTLSLVCAAIHGLGSAFNLARSRRDLVYGEPTRFDAFLFAEWPLLFAGVGLLWYAAGWKAAIGLFAVWLAVNSLVIPALCYFLVIRPLCYFPVERPGVVERAPASKENSSEQGSQDDDS